MIHSKQIGTVGRDTTNLTYHLWPASNFFFDFDFFPPLDYLLPPSVPLGNPVSQKARLGTPQFSKIALFSCVFLDLKDFTTLLTHPIPFALVDFVIFFHTVRAVRYLLSSKSM